MLKRSRRKFECDFLEERTLLSTAHAQVAAHRAEVRAHAAEVRAERAEARADARLAATDQTSGSGTPGTVVGGGLISPGPALPNNQFDLFQQVAIDNNAMMFLTEFEALKGTTATLQQASASVQADGRNLSLLASNVANTLGVPLPYDLQGSVAATVKTATQAANSSTFEKSYLSAMASVGSTMIGQLQMMEASGINSSLSTFAATALPIVQTDVAAIATVGGGGTNPLTPVSTTPSSTSLSSTDLSTLETYYSGSWSEWFLGQLTSLTSTNNQVVQYGEKLLNDHGLEINQLGMYAAATGTYLPAAITSSSDLSTTTSAISAITTSGSSSSYDTTFLQGAVSANASSISNEENTINTTSNLVLKAMAVSDVPTDLMHLNNALYDLEQMGAASGSTRATVRVADRLAHKALREARR